MSDPKPRNYDRIFSFFCQRIVRDDAELDTVKGTPHVVAETRRKQNQLFSTVSSMTLFRRITSRKNRIQCTRNRLARKLVFDLLEERRLLAGLDVWVFDDSNESRSFDHDLEYGVPRQVVYVDLNKNASHDRNEPIAISNFRGVASFPDLEPGSYSIRLLGENSSRMQTFPVVPGTTGTIDDSINLDKVVQSLGESGLLGISGSRLQRIDSDGSIVHNIEFPGEIVDTTWNGDTGLILVDTQESRQLYLVEDGTATLMDNNASGIHSVGYVGESFYLWSENEGLIRAGISSNRPIDMWIGGEFQSFSSAGNDRIVVEESLNGKTRLSIHQIRSSAAALIAERTFESDVLSWHSSNSGNLLIVETEQGIQILDVTNGLQTQEVLEGAVGPILIDPVSSLLYTGVQGHAKSLQSWQLGSWITGERVELDPLQFSGDVKDLTLSHDGRQLVGPTGAGLFRQDLAVATGLTAAVRSNFRTSVALGVSLTGPSVTIDRVPFNKTWTLEEDKSHSIDLENLVSESGQTLYAVLLTEPGKGQIEWSVETGGVYIPNPNAEGLDSMVLAFFDGRNWTPSERIEINILPSNDPPTAIVIPRPLEVNENVSGGVVGTVFVDDIDLDSSYRWEVSDSRFEVKDGVLKLVDNIALDFEESESIELMLRAIDATVSETSEGSPFAIQTSTTVRLKSNPLPTVLHVADQYTIPEKTLGVLLGYVYVSGEKPASDYTLSVSDPRFEVVNGSLKLRSGQYVSWSTTDSVTVTLTATSTSGEQLSKNTLIRVIPNALPNPYTGPDPDGDGQLTPIDVLLVVNHINKHGSGPVASPVEGEPNIYNPDVDGDGKVTSIDILILVNWLNRRKRGLETPHLSKNPQPLDGEGEAMAPQVENLAPDLQGTKRRR